MSQQAAEANDQETRDAAPSSRPSGYPAYTPPAPTRHPGSKSPVLAGVLSIVPGLGQIYMGYYLRGFIHIVVVGALISIIPAGPRGMEPLFGFFLPFFWLYNIIDATRLANLYNLALEGGRQPELPKGFALPTLAGSITAGVLLMAGSAVLLLHTLLDLSLDWIADWWPAAPLAFGGWLLWKGIQEKKAGVGEES